jgi:preprotein translocase subunit YajC
MPSILVFVLFFAGVYFLLLRPQQQRVRRQRALITAIGVGDRVVTAGGLIGRVVDLSDDRLQLEIADGVVVELLRLAISRRLDDSEPDSGFGDASSADDDLDEEYTDEEHTDGEHTDGEHTDGFEEPAGDQAVAGGSGPASESAAAGPTDPPRRAPATAGPDGTIEEAATPAPGQDPL